jgi:hypothetical protein
MPEFERATVSAPRWWTAAALLTLTDPILPETNPAVMPASLALTNLIVPETNPAVTPASLALTAEFMAIVMPSRAGSPSRAPHSSRFWPHVTPAHRAPSDPSLTTKRRISSLTAGNRR